MILVAGSTGLLGGEICRQLASQQKPVRALVRKTSSAEKVGALKSLAAEWAEGDLKDKASLMAACKGCEVVISTVSSTLSRQEGDNLQTVDLEGQLNLVEAAKESGVRQFIFISSRNDSGPDFPLAHAKRTVEQRLKECGMAYTILKASFFMEIWLSPVLGFNYAGDTLQIPGEGVNPVSFVSYKDVASLAAMSVGNAAAANAVIEIGGPEALTPAQVIEIFEEASGHAYTINYIPTAALEEQLKVATDPMQLSFSAIMLLYAKGDPIEMTETVKQFPMVLHSVRDYAKAVLQKEVEPGV